MLKYDVKLHENKNNSMFLIRQQVHFHPFYMFNMFYYVSIMGTRFISHLNTKAFSSVLLCF